jgi:STE24 endopeptidase
MGDCIMLSHEIGHAKKGHILTSAPLGFLAIAIMLAAAFFVVTMPAVSQAFGFEYANVAFGVYVLFIMLSPIMLLMQIPAAALSRKHEYEADAIGKELAGSNAMVSSLKTLYRESFGNLTPHPFVVMMEYSHPPLTDRIRAIEGDKS